MTEVEEFQEMIGEVDRDAQQFSMKVNLAKTQAKGVIQALLMQLSAPELTPEQQTAISQGMEAQRQSIAALAKAEIDGTREFANRKLDMQRKLNAYQSSFANARQEYEAKIKESDQQIAAANARFEHERQDLDAKFQREASAISQQINSITHQMQFLQTHGLAAVLGGNAPQ